MAQIVVASKRPDKQSCPGFMQTIPNGDDVSINQLRGRVAAARSVEPVAAVRLEARLDRILNNDMTA
ncbi:MAG: hypothetical protein ABTQ28_00340 [Thauera sp.]